MQTEIACSVRDNERTAIKSGNGTGKTYISAGIVLWFLYSFNPSKVITTAPTDRQVSDLLWSEIGTIYGKSKIPLGGRLLQKNLELDDNWFAVGFATREYDPEKFQGYHAPHILVIFDEASGIPPGIWDGAEGLLTSGHSRFLAIGNPTDPTSEFAKCFRASSGWSKKTISCWDTPNVKAGKNIIPGLVSFDWPQKKLEQWGSETSAYRVKVLGEFPESSDDTLIPLHLIEAARDKDIPEGEPCELGNDVAYGGNDKSVFIIRRGSRVVYIGAVDVRDTTRVAGRSHQLAREFGAKNIKVDVIGIGAGVHDQLVNMAANNYQVSAINVAEKAIDSEKFLKPAGAGAELIIDKFFDGVLERGTPPLSRGAPGVQVGTRRLNRAAGDSGGV